MQAQAPGSESIDPRSFVRIRLPADSPLELVAVDYDGSRVTRSEREIHFDLSLTLALRNRSSKPVDGLAMGLGYGFPGPAPASEGLNAASGIELRPGQTFALPARIRGDIEAPPATSRARPVDLPAAAVLSLDAVLFQDGSAYGPDRLGMIAPLRINRAEASRDRRYLESLAASSGPSGVARRLEQWSEVWEQQAEISPRTLSGPRAESLRSHAVPARVEIVNLPAAPLEILSAAASFSEGRFVDPAVEVRNIGPRAISDFQFVWVFRDASGAEFRGRTSGRGWEAAGRARMPALGRGERVQVPESLVFEAARRNRETEIVSARVILRAVEFADGQVWVPERAVLDSLHLGNFLPPSSETTRLWHAYRQRGPQGLMAELKRSRGAD